MFRIETGEFSSYIRLMCYFLNFKLIIDLHNFQTKFEENLRELEISIPSLPSQAVVTIESEIVTLLSTQSDEQSSAVG